MTRVKDEMDRVRIADLPRSFGNALDGNPRPLRARPEDAVVEKARRAEVARVELNEEDRQAHEIDLLRISVRAAGHTPQEIVGNRTRVFCHHENRSAASSNGRPSVARGNA